MGKVILHNKILNLLAWQPSHALNMSLETLDTNSHRFVIICSFTLKPMSNLIYSHYHTVNMKIFNQNTRNIESSEILHMFEILLRLSFP